MVSFRTLDPHDYSRIFRICVDIVTDLDNWLTDDKTEQAGILVINIVLSS